VPSAIDQKCNKYYSINYLFPKESFRKVRSRFTYVPLFYCIISVENKVKQNYENEYSSFKYKKIKLKVLVKCYKRKRLIRYLHYSHYHHLLDLHHHIISVVVHLH